MNNGVVLSATVLTTVRRSH